MKAQAPWTVNRREQYWKLALEIDDAAGRTVCVTTRGWQSDDEGDDDYSWDNARLIAAAPELLEACSQMRREYAAFGKLSQETQLQADNAIAKAEGK